MNLQTALDHHRAGRWQEAEAGYRAVLRTEPHNAPVHRLLGLTALHRGDLALAIRSFTEALRLRPDLVEAHVELGNALAAQGKLADAEAAYRRALAVHPQHLDALNQLGNFLQARRRFTEAATIFHQALTVDPQRPELHNNCGNALQADKNPAAAIAAYRAALALKPDFPEAHNNLGNVLRAEGQLADAIAAYERALALRPNYPDALNNLGNALNALGRTADALAVYRQSQQLQPAHGDAYFYESLALLSLGELAAGFARYEYRWRSELRGAQRVFPQPLWLGDTDLAGKTLLLYAEQGLGDTLQFVRYAALAAARGATVILEVQPALLPLLRGLSGVQTVIAQGDPLPAFDLHCPLLSLPHAFRTTLESIPARVPYLAPSPERAAHWRDRLAAAPRPRIGVMWSGTPHNKNDRNRSVPLELLRPVLAATRAQFHSLQKEYRSPDELRLAAELGIVDHSADLENFDDTAALIAQMDLVITVDTATAHLAGALGAPTWVLLPFAPDWRWLLHRDDTPWYPTLRLFRQTQPGDWAPALTALAARSLR